MGRVAVEMSMSLDGFVAGVNTDATNPLGENGELLHRWLFADPIDPADAQVAAEMRSSVGAVVVGRRTFDVGVDIWQDVPYPVPTFVLTHRPHEDVVMPSGTFTFVTSGVVEAVAAAQGGRRRAQGLPDGRDSRATGTGRRRGRRGAGQSRSGATG